MKHKHNICLLLALLVLSALFCSCSYKYKINTNPGDARITVDGCEYETGSIYKSRRTFVHVQAQKEGFEPLNIQISASGRQELNRELLELKPLDLPVVISSLYNCYPYGKLSGKNFAMEIDGKPVVTGHFIRKERKYLKDAQAIGEGAVYTGKLSWGKHSVTFKAEGYKDYSFPLTVSGKTDILIRHPFNLPEAVPKLRPLGVYECGFSPKQVDISPDGKYIYIALLSDKGFQVFDVESKKIVAYMKPNPDSKYEGFVEGLFIPGYKSYFISQMSTGKIFEYDVSDLSSPVFKRAIPVEGTWTKVIAYSEAKDLLAVSNWTSYTVSIIDYKSGKVKHKIPDLVEPRGLIFSDDGKYLYITTYLGGQVFKYNTADWKKEAEFAVKYSALRHLRKSLDEKTVYVSDMRWNRIYELDSSTLKMVRTYEVNTNPNSIDTSGDGKYLFVSTRGRNNPESYLRRSLEPGEVNIIDLENHKVISEFTAGTQPTGLDVAPDHSFFVLSNFQDHTIELFAIE